MTFAVWKCRPQRRRQICEDCGHVHFRPIWLEKPCCRCRGRVLVASRTPTGGRRPTTERIAVWVPRNWILAMRERERGSVPKFVRAAIAARLGVR